MIRLQCEACGASKLKRYGNMYVCGYCGSKYLLDSDGKEKNNILTEAKVIALLEKANRLHNVIKLRH